MAAPPRPAVPGRSFYGTLIQAGADGQGVGRPAQGLQNLLFAEYHLENAVSEIGELSGSSYGGFPQCDWHHTCFVSELKTR